MRRRGPRARTGARARSSPPPRGRQDRKMIDRLAVAVELAFLGLALVGLAFALDAVENLVPFRRQQLDHLKASARLRPAERPRGVLDRLSDRVLVTCHSRFPFLSSTVFSA